MIANALQATLLTNAQEQAVHSTDTSLGSGKSFCITKTSPVLQVTQCVTTHQIPIFAIRHGHQGLVAHVLAS